MAAKEIIIEIVHKEGTDTEIVNVSKTGLTWTETLGYLERAKAVITHSDR